MRANCLLTVATTYVAMVALLLAIVKALISAPVSDVNDYHERERGLLVEKALILHERGDLHGH